MKPPSLNGTTFYLGPAATINVTVTNGSDRQLFGYMVMEQKTGFPVASNIFGNVSSAQIVVPKDRLYTLMAVRINSQFAMTSLCNGFFMNDLNCSAPPRSQTINPSYEGQIVNVSLNLSIQRVNVYGCVGVSANLTAITNITSILPRMLPWEGFVPPMNPDTNDINFSSTAQLNMSDPRCSASSIAWYNLSLLNVNYLTEFYAKNASNLSTAEWL